MNQTENENRVRWKRIARVVTLSGFLIALLGAIGIGYGTSVWIDKQRIPIVLESRSKMRFIAQAYQLTPKFNSEDDVHRTIKIAHLVALAELGKKDTVEFSSDLSLAYKLLSSALSRKLPDHEAKEELSIERLLFFNRIQSLAIAIGRKISKEDSSVVVRNLLPTIKDAETKMAAQREIHIHEILNKGGPVEPPAIALDAPQDIYQAAHYYELGLAYCAAHASGGQLIDAASQYFAAHRESLIFLVSRNIDAPLIAAAERVGSSSECITSINSLKSIIGS